MFRACLFMLVVGVSVRGVLGGPPSSVGDLGDPDRLQFVGNQSFPADQLRSALVFDLGVLVAGHPDTPVPEYLNLVARRVADGYRHSGFPEVHVSGDYDDSRQQLVIAVEEGRRFQCGEIEIRGASKLPVEDFKRLLSTRRMDAQKRRPSGSPDSKPAIWSPGSPPSFAESHWAGQRSEIELRFHELGFFDVQFTTDVRAEQDGSATLVVSITDEGPCAILGEVEILGAQRHSVQEILEYLDLPAGCVLNAERKLQIERRLYESGRFLKSDIELVTPPFGDAPATLRVRVVELPDAPRLSDPLSPVQEVLLRLAQRLNTFETTSDDLLLRWKGAWKEAPEELQDGTVVCEIQCVISHARQACLLRLTASLNSGTPICDFWCHLHPRGIELGSPRHSLRYLGPAVSTAVRATVAWTANPPDREGRMSGFTVGMGADSNPNGTRPPFTLEATAAPAAALRAAMEHHAVLSLQNGFLTAQADNFELQIDAATGRLDRFRSNHSSIQGEVSARPGIYAATLKDYETSLQGATVIHGADVPLSNLLSFLMMCVPEPKVGDDPAMSTAVTLAHRLLKRGGFHAFDALLQQWIENSEDRFQLPGDGDLALRMPRLTWHAVALPFARLISPPPSWIWTMTRVLVFLPSNPPQESMRVISDLLNDEQTGPLCSLVSAEAFGLMHPQLRIAFAQRGLTRMKQYWFEQDCEPLLRDGTPVGKLLTAVAQTLQESDPAELELLVSLISLSNGDRETLLQVLRDMASSGNVSPREALQQAIDDAWEPLIKPRLEELLQTRGTSRE